MRRFRAATWGDVAAEKLGGAWLGRVWQSDAHALTLVSQAGEPLRLVTPTLGVGPFDVVVAPEMVALGEQLPHGLYTWRVGGELWLGDDLTLDLPTAAPWPSTLEWRRGALEVPPGRVARHLAMLGDWLLARAPEGSMSGVLPELLAAGQEGLPQRGLDRPYLSTHDRLFRWRAARALGSFVPSLARGDMAQAEDGVNHLAGLGSGEPPAGDWYVLGVVAGVRLWPEFLSEGSGLREEALLLRLVRSVRERTSLLGRATLAAALDENRWGAHWHMVHAALLASGGYPDDRRDDLLAVAARWLEQDPAAASAALGGLVTPFLWYQRHFA